MPTWRPIENFPGYQVSDAGEIWSDKTQQVISTSQNEAGVEKINLVRDGRIYTRSVRVLVAEAFLPKQEALATSDEDLPTPINLDGDPRNNTLGNLAWRPRWFAWKYAHQFKETVPTEFIKTPVIDIEHGKAYDSVCDAGVKEGLIWEYIYNSILTGKPVYPTGGIFGFSTNIRS